MSELMPVPTPERPERKEKPAVLYHATNKEEEITEFEPRRESVRDPKEGPVIFATQDKAYALQFLVEGDNKTSIRGYYNNIPTVVICARREDFEKQDRGGSVYVLPSDAFDFDPSQSMKEREWTSRKPVKPISREQYSSTIGALIEHGVQVYFVDQETFAAMRSQKTVGFETLLTLTSENEKQGKNVRKYKEE